MPFRTDDPYTDYLNHEREQERLAAKLPKCDICGRTVDDQYYNIYGETVCEDCLAEHFRVTVEI